MSVPRSRRVLALGGLLTVLGLAIGAMSPVVGANGARLQVLVGGTVVVVGWATLAWGVHRFGREST